MVQALIANHKLPLEAGAVPPLPDIYGVEGLLDQALAAEDDIIFKAGNNSQLIQMSMMDFRTLSPITLGSFTEEMDVHLRCATCTAPSYQSLHESCLMQNAAQRHDILIRSSCVSSVYHQSHIDVHYHDKESSGKTLGSFMDGATAGT